MTDSWETIVSTALPRWEVHTEPEKDKESLGPYVVLREEYRTPEQAVPPTIYRFTQADPYAFIESVREYERKANMV